MDRLTWKRIVTVAVLALHSATIQAAPIPAVTDIEAASHPNSVHALISSTEIPYDVPAPELTRRNSDVLSSPDMLVPGVQIHPIDNVIISPASSSSPDQLHKRELTPAQQAETMDLFRQINEEKATLNEQRLEYSTLRGNQGKQIVPVANDYKRWLYLNMHATRARITGLAQRLEVLRDMYKEDPKPAR